MWALLLGVFVSTLAATQVAPSICDGKTDARAALQEILTQNAGKTIVLPDGAVCLITPVSDKSKFLSLPAGTVLRGHGTLKVANSSAPYNSVLYSTSCSRCQVSELTIDSNIANNPIADAGEILAHARTEMAIFGDDLSFRGITIMNTSAVNSIIATGARITVESSTFKAIGDDPHHIAHDHSTLYLTGSQILVRGNQFTATGRDSPAGVTAIETHGTGQTITGNSIADFTNGINVTGVASEDSEANVVSENSLKGVLYCITLWSRIYRGHTTGYGINGLVVSGNSCRINQLSYTHGLGAAGTSGIVVEPASSLPIANLSITNNVVVFDLEIASRKGSTSSIGLGWWSANHQTAMNVSIANNIVDNAPVAAIRMAVGSATGLVIRDNIIRDAGSSLDGSVSSGYKTPIFVFSTSGGLQADIEGNAIVDDLASSRMGSAMVLGGAAKATHHVRVLDNSILLLGANTASFKSYVSILDNELKPLLRLIATTQPWNAAAYPHRMAAGSEVFDSTNATHYDLPADGTNWTKTRSPASDSSGTIVLTAATSASVNFPTAWSQAPVCTLTPLATLAQPYWVSSSTTAITATLSSPASITFNYICSAKAN